MKHKDFFRLVSEGEQAHIDFKIKCDAFADSGVATKGELAKDICAMANNGYRASYIFVGVSDDGQSFRSVDNPKLTDDNLQDFCKKAVYPPPKIKVHRQTWKRVRAAYQGKEFLIIQVGPNPRQAFHLAQDFIDYDERVCYRRNEVWIRRGATSDLATPEEIARLVSGKSPYTDPAAEERQAARRCFSSLSHGEQKALIYGETETSLEARGYDRLPEEDWFWRYVHYQRKVFLNTMWKTVNSTTILICLESCRSSLTAKDLEAFYGGGWPWFSRDPAPYSTAFVVRGNLPTVLSPKDRRGIEAVRRICLVPVIRSVPASRISQALPGSRRIESSRHFYRRHLHGPRRRDPKEGAMLPSSSELLVIDSIQSRLEYREALEQAIEKAEDLTMTLVSPVGAERQ